MDLEQRKAIEIRLEKIRARNSGVLTPDAVIQDARQESSPLHNYFTWDDTAAAHQFRLDQARSLIRNVRVEVATTTSRIVAPFYIRDPRVSSDEQGYGSVAEIKNEAEVAADALRYEVDRVIGALERAVSIADALGLSGQVEALMNKAKILRRHIPVEPIKNRSDAKKVAAKSVARKTKEKAGAV